MCHVRGTYSHKERNWKWPTLPNCFTVNGFNLGHMTSLRNTVIVTFPIYDSENMSHR